MASDAQLAANRRNAQLSTGPKTPEGKAAVSQNAVRHGLTGRHIILADEDPDAFEDLHSGLTADHRPKTTTEQILVRRMAEAEWRIRRITRRESTLLNINPSYEQPELNLLNRYEGVHVRTLFRSLDHLDRYKANPKSAPHPNAQAAAASLIDDLASTLATVNQTNPIAVNETNPVDTNETNPIPPAMPPNPKASTNVAVPRPQGSGPLATTQTNPIPPNPNPPNTLTTPKPVDLTQVRLLRAAQKLRDQHAAGGNPNIVAGMDRLLAVLLSPPAPTKQTQSPAATNPTAAKVA